MSYVKIVASHNSPTGIQKYLEKNGRCRKETTIGIGDEKNWGKDMETLQELYGKDDGVRFQQIIFSPEKDEGNEHYNVKDIHQMGVRIAQKFADKGFQVIVATHDDNGLIHDHIIINTVNPLTGKKLRISNARSEEYQNDKVDIYMRDIYKMADEISREYGLKTLSESKEAKNQKAREQGRQPENRRSDETYLEEKGKSYKQKMRQALQTVWKDPNITTPEEFELALEENGIKIARVTNTGHITYQDEEGHKVRGGKLGAFDVKERDELLQKNRDFEEQRERQQRIKTGRGR